MKERPDDVLPLFHHFLKRASEKANRPIPKLEPGLERVLQQYGWPGNVRELENEANRLLALTRLDDPIRMEHLSSRITQAVSTELESLATLEQREKELVALHLRLAGGN